MSRELRLFGTTSALQYDVDVFLDRVNVGTYSDSKQEWRDGGDRIQWVLACVTDQRGEWKMQICGLEYSLLTMHTSMGHGITTEEQYLQWQENVRFAQSRLRHHQ